MKLNKIFKISLLVLIVVGVAVLIYGAVVGFESSDGQPVDLLLYWAYIMVGIAVASCILIGLIVSIKNDPKSLIRIGLVLAGAAVLCLISFLLAPGSPAVGYTGTEELTHTTLKLTDTILNLTYICGAGAILAIIIGEVRMAIANKK